MRAHCGICRQLRMTVIGSVVRSVAGMFIRNRIDDDDATRMSCSVPAPSSLLPYGLAKRLSSCSCTLARLEGKMTIAARPPSNPEDRSFLKELRCLISD